MNMYKPLSHTHTHTLSLSLSLLPFCMRVCTQTGGHEMNKQGGYIENAFAVYRAQQSSWSACICMRHKSMHDLSALIPF
jgi:hypothetical protein